MNSLARLGEAVGEYSGHGQGEQENPTQLDQDGENDEEDSMETCDTNSETSDSKPVHIFFDIDTIGLSIYNDHVTEIGEKVVGAPAQLSIICQPCAHSTQHLLSRYIHSLRKNHTTHLYVCDIQCQRRQV